LAALQGALLGLHVLALSWPEIKRQLCCACVSAPSLRAIPFNSIPGGSKQKQKEKEKWRDKDRERKNSSQSFIIELLRQASGRPAPTSLPDEASGRQASGGPAVSLA